MSALVRPAPLGGPVEDVFWAHVARRRLHLQRCEACGHRWFPPGPGCPACLSDAWTWEPARGSGSVLTWCTFHRPYFPTVPVPHTVAVVELDEGPLLVADVVTGADGLAAGVRAHLVYRDAEDPTGSTFTLYSWSLVDHEATSDPRGASTDA